MKTHEHEGTNNDASVSFNTDAKIWRYIDLAKFVALLSKRSLFLTRLDNLSDPIEGRGTSNDHAMWKLMDDIGHPPEEIGKHTDTSLQDGFLRQIKLVRESMYVSCWHISENESAGMWASYASMDKGIAIQSTIRRLQAVLSNSERQIHISKVAYIDRAIQTTSSNNLFGLGLTKGNFYAYENEIRAFYFHFSEDRRYDAGAGHRVMSSENNIKYGFNIPIDIDLLIETVYISPMAPTWFLEIVESLSETYNLTDVKNKVRYSVMREDM